MLLRYLDRLKRRKVKSAEQHAHLSGPERADLARMRQEHSPIGELARRGVPPQLRDRRC